MPYPVYKLIHYLGIFLVFLAMGGSLAVATWLRDAEKRPGRKLLGSLHGIGLFLILLGGFGLMSRIGVTHGELWPGWIWVKAGIWILLGAMVMIPARRPGWGRPALLALPVLGLIAAYMALYKPF